MTERAVSGLKRACLTRDVVKLLPQRNMKKRFVARLISIARPGNQELYSSRKSLKKRYKWKCINIYFFRRQRKLYWRRIEKPVTSIHLSPYGPTAWKPPSLNEAAPNPARYRVGFAMLCIALRCCAAGFCTAWWKSAQAMLLPLSAVLRMATCTGTTFR